MKGKSAPAGGEMAVACALDAPDPDAMLAVEQVVIAYRVRIVMFVARMLRDEARAEDVAQDAFVRAYRALQTYPAERRASLHLRPWLFAIAHNLTRNALRDAPPASAPLEHDDGAPRAELTDPAAGPEHLVLREEA